MPYLPYSNQKQPYFHPLKDIAQLLEVVGADQIITFNCINSDSKGYFNIPFINIDVTGIASQYLADYHKVKDAVVLTPQAQKDGIRRAVSMIQHLEKEGCKGRLAIQLSETIRYEQIKTMKYSYLGPNLKGKDVIIVDSQCLSALTLKNAVESAIQNGANRIFSFVPHSTFSSQTQEQLVNLQIKEYITTNTLAFSQNNNQRIRVFSIAKLLAECIKRLHFQNYYQAHTPIQKDKQEDDITLE